MGYVLHKVGSACGSALMKSDSDANDFDLFSVLPIDKLLLLV